MQVRIWIWYVFCPRIRISHSGYHLPLELLPVRHDPWSSSSRQSNQRLAILQLFYYHLPLELLPVRHDPRSSSSRENNQRLAIAFLLSPTAGASVCKAWFQEEQQPGEQPEIGHLLLFYYHLPPEVLPVRHDPRSSSSSRESNQSLAIFVDFLLSLTAESVAGKA